MAVVGVDVGGTKIAAGLVEDAEIVERAVVPTPLDGPAAVLDTIADLVRRLAPAALTGVGVGTGGVIDHATGRVVSATALLPGWAGTPVADELRARVGVPVAVDNDGNAMALGEHHFGAGRGCRDAIYVAVGTGIAGGIVLAGRLVRGAHHSGGELGHLPAPGAVGRLCSCGLSGHLEAAASGPAMTERYRELSGDREIADLRAVEARAVAGDAVARDVLGEGAAVLGRMLGGLANTLDPQAVIVGGGVARAGEAFWRPLTEAFRGQLLPGPAAVRLAVAERGTDAGLLGAAFLLTGTA